MKSYQKPTVDKVKDARKKLTSIHLRRHFYKNLENPEWVDVLYILQAFKNAPEPLREGDTIRYIDWPELEYLERVANDKPETAYKVVKSLDTNNDLVLDTALKIISKLPNDKVSALVPVIIKWFDKLNYISFFVVESLTDLAENVAKEKIPEGLNLIEKLIFGYNKKVSENEFITLTPKISQSWNFKDAVDKVKEPAIFAYGIQYLDMLCKKLEEVLKVYGDYSVATSWWQNAIEDHSQDRHSDELKNILVYQIRDVSLELLKTDPAKVMEIVSSYDASIFKRIKIYLSGADSISTDQQIDQFLNDISLFWNIDLNHEIYHFIRIAFPSLDKITQTKLLDIIKAGPPEKDDGSIYKFRKYDAIKDYLYGEYVEDYRSLPNIPNADFLSYMSDTWIGPTSPIEFDELKSYPAEALSKFLNEWKPSEEWHSPSRRGLGRVIEADMKVNSSKYLLNLELFKIDEPTYISHILAGIRDLPKEAFTEDVWSKLIDFCKWIVSKDIIVDGRDISDDFNDDQDWSSARYQVVSLLDAKIRTAGLGQREDLWSLIYKINEQSQPLVEESQDENTSADTYTAAINSVDGEALHAAIEYGLWLRSIDKEIELPELFTLLDQRLERNFDNRGRQRAVFGRFIPWLHLLSTKWANESCDKIFPIDNIDAFASAWVPYISYCDVYDDIFKLLEEKYLFALKNHEAIDTERGYYGSRLAGHIITEYLRGKFELNSKLLKKVLLMDIAKEGVKFAGQSLSASDVPADVMERGIKLWESYIESLKLVGKYSSPNIKRDLSVFSTWFSSDMISPEWRIIQIFELLKDGVKFRNSFEIFEGLVDLSSNYLQTVFEILNEMVELDAVEFMLLSHKKELHDIFKHTILVEDVNIRKSARKLINTLGKRGAREFVEYLEKLQ